MKGGDAKSLSQRLREAQSKEEMDALIAQVPYAQFLGLDAELTGTGDGETLILRMPFHDRLIGDSTVPALHGGTVGALLESTAIFTVLRATAATRMPKTVTLTVDYLRVGRGGETWASAVITKKGRQIVIARAEAWQEDRDKPIASANVHFLLRAPTTDAIS